MKIKTKNRLLALFAFLSCFILYMLLGLFVLRSRLFPAKVAPEPVEDMRGSGSFCLLFSCDELEQYASVKFDYDNERVDIKLFSQKSEALFQKEEYDRKINYTSQGKIDLIGWLGGIVIEENICYNDNNCELISGGERIFGVRAEELSLGCDTCRALIAKKIFAAILSLPLKEDDFPFLFGLCESDISYADYCRQLPFLEKLNDKITVSMG